MPQTEVPAAAPAETSIEWIREFEEPDPIRRSGARRGRNPGHAERRASHDRGRTDLERHDVIRERLDESRSSAVRTRSAAAEQ